MKSICWSIITPVTPNTILAENDILVFTGAVDTIVELEQIPGLVPRVESEFRHHPERHLVEVVLSRKFPLLQTTIREASFRQRYNAAIVAVHREGERLQGKVGDITLQAGDTLLCKQSMILSVLTGTARLFTWSQAWKVSRRVITKKPERPCSY